MFWNISGGQPSGYLSGERKEESGYYVATKKKQGEYTIEDYRKLPEDERAELIDGTIYDMAAPLSVHQLLASKIYSSLAGYIEKNQDACIPMFAPVDVQLDQDDKTMVQPDLMIVCDRKSLPDRGFLVRRILLLRSCLKVQGRRTVI